MGEGGPKSVAGPARERTVCARRFTHPARQGNRIEGNRMRRADAQGSSGAGGGRLFWRLVIALAAAFVAAIFLPAVVYKSYSIPASSMNPGLLIGDYVFLPRLSYGLNKHVLPRWMGVRTRVLGRLPERGDVAVFALPRDPSVYFVKRVIGLPGETVELRGGRLLINGVGAGREPAGLFDTADYDGRATAVPCFRETLPNGAHYLVLDGEPHGMLDTAGPFKVPAGHYFVLGDNRDNSVDSRTDPEKGGVGYVPYDNFAGRMGWIFFSTAEGRVHLDRIGRDAGVGGCRPAATP